MKTVAACGIFTCHNYQSNGQTVKSNIFLDEFKNIFSNKNIEIIDYGGTINRILMFPRLVKALIISKNIVIFPAENALPFMAIWLVIWNIIFHRKIHYVVIGGWLPNFVESHVVTKKMLKRFDYIYVETSIMRNALLPNHFKNVIVMPNCKRLTIVNPNYSFEGTVKLVTFSRVMKEKGIEYALQATKYANSKVGDDIFELDIYGDIIIDQRSWFKELQAKFPPFVKYKGCIPFSQSTQTLCNYYALLFPTYYSGEGFAGTLIDSFAASLPPIVSDWHNNSEIVEDRVTGLIVPVHDVVALGEAIIWSYLHKHQWDEMRNNCREQAIKYLPEKVIPIITSNF